MAFCFQWHRHILFDPADSGNALAGEKGMTSALGRQGL